MSVQPGEVETLLRQVLPARHVGAAVEHFAAAVGRFQSGDWEACLTKAGKFIEAVAKALAEHVGQPAPRGRAFKVDAVLRMLEQTQQNAFPDAIRLTIPRACRFVYDVASNRGARHDPDEVDPNEMDATASVALCAWILAELLRYSQKGEPRPERARELVSGLVERRYPILESIEGRTYFNARKTSARDVALVLLFHEHPHPVSHERLLEGITRHNFEKGNASKAITRLRDVVDDDGNGNLRLRAPGLRQAEELLAHADPTP